MPAYKVTRANSQSNALRASGTYWSGKKKMCRQSNHEPTKQTESWLQILSLDCIFIKDKVPMAQMDAKVDEMQLSHPRKNRDDGGSDGTWGLIASNSYLTNAPIHSQWTCRERKRESENRGEIRPGRYVSVFRSHHALDARPTPQCTQSCLLTFPFCLSIGKHQLLPSSVHPLALSFFILNMGMYGTQGTLPRSPLFVSLPHWPKVKHKQKKQGSGFSPLSIFFFWSMVHVYRPVFSHTVVLRVKKKDSPWSLKLGRCGRERSLYPSCR